jgi:hypothetical protein
LQVLPALLPKQHETTDAQAKFAKLHPYASWIAKVSQPLCRDAKLIYPDANIRFNLNLLNTLEFSVVSMQVMQTLEQYSMNIAQKQVNMLCNVQIMTTLLHGDYANLHHEGLHERLSANFPHHNTTAPMQQT